LAKNVSLRTPSCYYSDLNLESGEHIVLLEDLAPAVTGDLAAGCSLEQAELAIREVARFHAHWWQDPKLEQLAWLRRSRDPADYQGFQQAYLQKWGSFLEKAGQAMPAMAIVLGERLGKHLAQVAEQLFLRPPRTLTHGDYHLQNLLFTASPKEDSLFVIDWQAVGCGRGIVDAALFLGTSLRPHERRAKEMELMEIYQATLADNGVSGYGFDRCFYDYRLSMLLILAAMVLNIGNGILTGEKMLRLMAENLVPRICSAILELESGALLPTQPM
jgi:hypothetical protein